MDRFQSSDVRDRLYGILSVVNWRGAAPVPDYTKDSFELATEVLRRILASGDDTFRFYTAMKWIRHIRVLFQVSPEQEAVRKAIEARHKPFTAAPTYVGSQESERLGGWEWHGTEIRGLGFKRESNQPVRSRRKKWSSRDVQKQHTPQLQCLERSLDQPFVQLRDDKGLVFAYAPSETRAGDWYLELRYGISDGL